MKSLSLIIGLSLLVWGCGAADRTDSPRDADAVAATEPGNPGSRLPNNTGVNERDADGGTTTPFDQSNSKADTDLVAEIRSRVLDIDGLSISGQNIKIMTNQARVMLRGPVTSSAERDAIVRVAEDIAGAANVTNELEVTPSS